MHGDLRRFREAFWQTGVAIAIVSLAGRFLEVNPAMCALFGYDESELLQLDSQSLTHPADAAMSAAWFREALEDGGAFPQQFTKRYVHRSGRVVWVSVNASIVRDDAGRLAYFAAHMQDVTEVHHAHTALRESEQRFRLMVDRAADAIFLMDANGGYLDVNGAACRSLGYSRDELLAMSVYDVACGMDRAAMAHRWSQTRAGAEFAIQSEHRRHDGTTFPVEVRVSATEVGGQLMRVAIARDVTERRRAEWLEDDRRQVLEMVAQDQPLPAVLHQIVKLVERQCAAARACVMVVEDGALHAFAPTLPRVLADAIERRPVSFAAGLTAAPSSEAAHQEPHIAPVEADAAWEGLRAAAREAGVRCAWAVTVHARDGVPLGLVVACAADARPPTASESGILNAAARLATIAIEHHQTTRQLAHLVRHDPLTGLPNRILFEDRLQQALAAARRTRSSVALLAMDLNRFKSVNDTLGHQAGDAMLQQFAQCVRESLRETDTLARTGGDEFMLILPGADREAAEMIVSRLHEALASTPMNVGGRELYASSSIGIAVHPGDGDDPAGLQRAADAEMYRQKDRRRHASTSPSSPPSQSSIDVAPPGQH